MHHARRAIRGILATALGAASLTLATSGAGPAGAAGGTITPWSTSVAVGAAFSASANGCPADEEDTDTSYSYQRAELVLITGTGASERLAAFGQQVEGIRYRFRVPGWVDPAEPAVIAGRCIKTTYSYGDPDGPGSEATTTTFTFADAPIDITAATGPVLAPTFTVTPDTAAGGQVVTISGSGCAPSSFVDSVAVSGGDLSGRTGGEYVTYGSGQASSDGSFSFELPLNTVAYEGPGGGGPADPGPYAVLLACFLGEYEGYFAAPQSLTVAGTFPSDQIEASVADDLVTVAGSGCAPGETVTVTFEGYAYDGAFEDLAVAQTKALARRSLGSGARIAPDDQGSIDEAATTVAAADGTWVVSSPVPGGTFDLVARADCGDPTTTGFRYVERYVYDDDHADLYVQRASPTSSPTGGLVDLHLFGTCDGDVSVALTDESGEVVSASEPFALGDYEMGSGTVRAPDEPGTYLMVGRCDDETSFPDTYEVFDPQMVAATEPLADEPSEGWPTRGARETYEGRLGPITLPPMRTDMEDPELVASGRALGPSELFIDVPRPDGDFAITKITFDLVDAAGEPVDQSDAHLHHFVVTNTSEKNPACPGGTFGLSGQIVAASGAERTALETGDPYGLVVEDTDDWSGVYELMSRSAASQEVYLSYDITFRRDIENVRPVTTYFSSATGCSTFTWTIDGSGTPDTQSHHVTIAEDARLIGAGGHIHNGGLHSDLVNDRGRRLCRSELQTGDAPAHGGHMTGGGYPPEFYPDDPEILGITTCAVAEQLSAGERLRFDATYENERARSGVMGISTFYVWEGGGPGAPGPAGAEPIGGSPNYTG